MEMAAPLDFFLSKTETREGVLLACRDVAGNAWLVVVECAAAACWSERKEQGEVVDCCLFGVGDGMKKKKTWSSLHVNKNKERRERREMRGR